MRPRRTPKGLLFDLDGVLVDSKEAWFRAVEQSGRRFRGRPVSRAEFEPTFGQGTAADVAAFGLRCSARELDDFYAEEFPRYLREVWVNPDAQPLLTHLRSTGTRVGLVTNSIEPIARALLERADLLEHFSVRATADRVTHAKPAPDLVELCARELGLPAAELAMVGDSRYDRQAAQSAGVYFIGLRIDADQRVESLRELLP